MNALERSLIEKTGHDFGFEYVSQETASTIILASARHPINIEVSIDSAGYIAEIVKGSALLLSELTRNFTAEDKKVYCATIEHLAQLLKRASALGHALPNQAEYDFDSAVAHEIEQLPEALKGTEVERMVRQRVGQQTYRNAMMDYWGGACAVTGIAIPQVLRASHAKPWADCSNDAERLDVFNGFLLSANLDALFDRFLISFDNEGKLIISKKVRDIEREKLGLNPSLKLRWIAPEHLCYLDHHRKRLS